MLAPTASNRDKLAEQLQDLARRLLSCDTAQDIEDEIRAVGTSCDCLASIIQSDDEEEL